MDTRDATIVYQEKNLGTNGTATQIIGVIEDCPFVAGVECFGKIIAT